MNMESFYGGPNGQSFYIKEIFTSKNGIVDSLKYDLTRGWTSPISVGEFVVISYGMPNDDGYDIYKQIDMDAEGKSYNSTLWQKMYDESAGNANGLSYRMVASMTGNTPRISIDKPITVLDANEQPDVTLDITDLDYPVFYFSLPQSQVLSMKQPTNVLDANQKPRVVYDDTKNINRPTLEFFLPQSQVINTAVVEEVLKANQDPQVRLDITDINHPIIKLKLPVSQRLIDSKVLHEVLDANVLPYITFDDTNIDEPTLKFFLPQSQVMQQPGTEVIEPEVNPSVSLNNTNINRPKLEFNLPRAVRFYYGSLLGERSQGTYVLTNPAFVDYGKGDYYINAETGFIYKVTSKIDTTCTFEYVACIQAPLPEVTTTAISPYNASKKPNTPSVVKSYTNDEQTKWKLEFKLPQMPLPSETHTFVGPLEAGDVQVTVKDENTINFDFTIPTGSRVFNGILVDTGKYDTIVPGAKPGDIYLNNKTGNLYELQKSGIWEIQEGNLKGPVGDALHIVREYTIVETDTLKDSLEAGKDYILDNYIDDQGNPLPLSPDEIFSITWVDPDDNSQISYWYYYTEDGQWGRAQLTGGTQSLIENTYNPETDGPVTNKTYSINYINGLIGGNLDIDSDKKTFSKDQFYELLSWGTWEDAVNGSPIPAPENINTLSADEIIELMSWGDISRLQI